MSQDLNLFYPLNEFYERAGLPLPAVESVEGSLVPEPYHSLLVHERDMTPTLGDAYQGDMRLRLIRKEVHDGVYSRQIVLQLESGVPVVFGAIKIYLDHFPAAARSLVLAEQRPLGAILQSESISHASRPEAYFRVNSDPWINDALRLTGAHMLYGRRNALWNSSERPLAHVVEILPPWSKPA
jgi:chorismate-pyruvate lyase